MKMCAFEGKHTTFGKRGSPRVPKVHPSVIRPNFKIIVASPVHSVITRHYFDTGWNIYLYPTCTSFLKGKQYSFLKSTYISLQQPFEYPSKIQIFETPALAHGNPFKFSDFLNETPQIFFIMNFYLVTVGVLKVTIKENKSYSN